MTWAGNTPPFNFIEVAGIINTVCHFYVPKQLKYSLIDKMAKYDQDMFHNYVAFLVSGHKCIDTNIKTMS